MQRSTKAPAAIDSLALKSPADGLSARRFEVLGILAKGFTNDEIGSALCISPSTVRVHVTAILSHLQVANRTEAAAVWSTWNSRPAQVARVLARPALAVLPFVPLSPGPRSRTIADGVARDLGSLFARFCLFPVISGVSSAAARAAGGSCAEMALSLGARFLVDGDVRSSKHAFRLSVRIDDAEDGCCLWTERFDFPRDDLFEVQDRACEAVVASAYPAMLARLQAGLQPALERQDLQAWELAHQAIALESTREPQANARAQAAVRLAIEREPTLVIAHFGLGLLSYGELLNQWGPKEAALDRLAQSAERCIALAPQAAEGHYLRGRHFQTRGDHAGAAAPLLEAIGRNPSFAPAHALLAQVLLLNGHPEEGLARMQHAVRLDPHGFVAGLAAAHFIRGAFSEALAAAERAIANNPGYPFARVVAVAAAYWLEDRPRAAAHMSDLRRLHPGFNALGFLDTFGPHVEAVERLAGALIALA